MKLFVTRIVFPLLAIIAMAEFLAGCTREKPERINLTTGKVMTRLTSAKRLPPIRLGMGAVITPKEGYAYYYALKEYLEKRIGWPIELVDRDTYEQINKMLKSGELNLAFVGAGPYIEGHDSYGLKILAAPVVNGSATFQSYIIVPQKSQIRDFQQLRGMTFAFTDPKSLTGRFYPLYILTTMNETPENFFNKIVYTYGHDKAIKAVAEGFVDGGAVSSKIWSYLSQTQPELTAKTRIIKRSPHLGIPPLAATKRLDPQLFNIIQETLINMHNDPEGKKILAGMQIDRFIIQPDSAYDSVREMNAFVAGRKGEK